MPVKDRNILERIFFLAIGLYCIRLLFLALDPAINTYQSKSWPTTTGSILTSQVAKQFCGRGHEIRYYPSIKYEYKTKRGIVTGSQIDFGDKQCESEDAATEIAKRYKIGQSVKLYITPHNTDNAVLITGSVLSALNASLFPLLFFGFISLLCVAIGLGFM